MSTHNVTDYIDCRSGYGCGETHLHCTDCNAIVELSEPKRCTYCCSYDARCRDCALDHYDQHHRRAAENAPAWEQVP